MPGKKLQKTEAFNLLKNLQQRIKDCTLCPLYKGATNPVPGSGNPLADVFFIGEAPGKNEDLQGEPFVGASGKFLDVLLHHIGFKRTDVFITSVLKHRPPDNRSPRPSEIQACSGYLLEQLMIIRPKVVVLLGRHAMELFLPGLKISEAHGKLQRGTGIWNGQQLFLPLYHPAAVLYNRSLQNIAMKDFEMIPKMLKKVVS